MTTYSEIEIQTAENLLKMGFKWITRNKTGRVFAHSEKPCKALDIWWPAGVTCWVCEEFVPIFQSIRSDDKEPVSLESIVHPQILDDAERRYLKGVIRPFRDDVKYIIKIESIYRLPDDGAEYIKICMCSDEDINLPYFRYGTMYKGMEVGRKYTLEELGL